MTQRNPLNKHELCLKEDAFLSDKTIWIASLSNGIDIYQDDKRPNIQEPSAWKRLGSYIKKAYPTISIVRMKVKFRSHIIELPPNAKGYYFAHGMSKSSVDNVQRGYLVCGHIPKNADSHINSIMISKWYSIPELIPTNENIRAASELQAPFLILNPT